MSKSIENYRVPMELTKTKDEKHNLEKELKKIKEKLKEACSNKDWKMVEDIVEKINL